MKNDIKIAISGRSGCGNTTISKMTSDALNLRFVNFTFRALAQERGLDLKKVMELAAEDESWDREIDTRQMALARQGGGCVIGSRLAIWMLKEADVKVYLYASAETRARRILKREGGQFDEVFAFTEERDRQDHLRYLKIYNIDTRDYSFADLIIDTGNLTPEEITDLIVKKAQTVV
ncbi:MAG: AAA family ATPase [Treponema sp.]|jgi:cytidylate kinase|nr:AAA family ATPase [Treponema sp.]